MMLIDLFDMHKQIQQHPNQMYLNYYDYDYYDDYGGQSVSDHYEDDGNEKKTKVTIIRPKTNRIIMVSKNNAFRTNLASYIDNDK